jgi:pimeloyl-ACP methyl ester carboxylesterase
MIAVTVRLPATDDGRPPIVLVHGAANSAVIWTYWQQALARDGWASYAIDLRGHGASHPLDLSSTSMRDYTADVGRLVEQLSRRPVLIGWSMGGLVAMMAASTGGVTACVGLAPSMPARTVEHALPLRSGVFGAEEYGITSRDPDDQPAMPDLDLEERQIALASLCSESRFARDERQRGIVVESLPIPLLILTGSADRQWPRERYRDFWLTADHLTVDGASHWGLVLNRRALGQAVPAVLGWLGRVANSTTMP